MRWSLAALCVLAFCGPARGAPPDQPLLSLPYVPGLDLDAMDRSVDPCADFYAFSCNGWIARNPRPADEPAWSVYRKMEDENGRFLWGILERAAGAVGPRTIPEQKVGDYYAACMDEAAIEAAGATPLRRDLAEIAALRSVRGVGRVLGRLHPSLEAELLFGLGSEQDARDSRKMIAALEAGGLGLPDRDYYLSDEPAMRAARASYRDHLAHLLELVGDAPETARAASERVVRLETALARATLDRVSRRDPRAVYHPVTVAQLRALTPSFDWVAYLGAARAPPLKVLNLREPAFLLEVEALLRSEPLGTWKEYLRARLVDSRAPYLSRPFQRAAFEFRDRYLAGVEEEPPRWKRCVDWVDRDLGEALGQLFVARAFPESVKAQVRAVSRGVQAAMAARIRESAWMGERTRRAALEKLAALNQKIGYPDRWRDYAGLGVSRRGFVRNVERARRFETSRQLSRIGRTVDRGEWDMTPQTVNAYYHPQLNAINFPAGVLLPPLWDPQMDLAPGYGNTGATVGHELTHAFDDTGRRFDARGNLRDWWTAEDDEAFRARTGCLVEQYGRYQVVDDQRVQSEFTVGEDLADLGGAILAWGAWKDATRGRSLEPRDGLTPEQRFFVGMAQWACGTETEESLRVRARTDPHSPRRWRVNGVVANMPEFREAFSCPAGAPLAPEKICRVW